MFLFLKNVSLLKLQGLGRMLIDQWDLMDTPVDERNKFDHVTSLIACTVDEVSKQGCLAIDIIEQVIFISTLLFIEK